MDSPTSKEKLPDWLRRWYALKGEPRFREAADEIERLQDRFDIVQEQLEKVVKERNDLRQAAQDAELKRLAHEPQPAASNDRLANEMDGALKYTPGKIISIHRTLAEEILAALRATHEPPAVLDLPEPHYNRADNIMEMSPDDWANVRIVFGHLRQHLQRSAQPPASEWQPIETAPADDGFECLIAAPGHYPKHNNCLVGEARRYDEQWYWAQLDPSDGCPVYPTHWMPLPSPPTKEAR